MGKLACSFTWTPGGQCNRLSFIAVTPPGVRSVSLCIQDIRIFLPVFQLRTAYTRIPASAAESAAAAAIIGLTLSAVLVRPLVCSAMKITAVQAAALKNATVINARFTCFLISFSSPHLLEHISIL